MSEPEPEHVTGKRNELKAHHSKDVLCQHLLFWTHQVAAITDLQSLKKLRYLYGNYPGLRGVC